MRQKTNASAIYAAKQEWQQARPSSAMTTLAAAGLDSGQRRYILRTWGASVDDAIDFSSDRYVMDEEVAPFATAELHRRSHGAHGFDKFCPACVDGSGNER